MPYNDKYFFEFDTLKTANKVTKYYRVVFSKLEDIAVTYDLVQLTPSNSPFVLSYRSPEDNAFSPIKTSSAEINILYPYDAGAGVPIPDDFFGYDKTYQWQVKFYEITSNGAVTALKWQGFLIDNDIQYEWQDAYYYRMTATDNLSVIKDFKFTDPDEFRCPDYDTFNGVSVAEYISYLLRFTGNELNCKFAGALFNDGVELTLDLLYTSLYTGIDWKKRNPIGMYEILNDLLQSLGCIIYLDNADGKWTVLMINEISNRPNNEVPYVEYDSNYNYVGAGDIAIGSSINLGENDLIWRDANQIVTLKKPYNNIKFTHKYIPKNLSSNYSFQQDLIHTGFDDVGTFNSDVELLAPFAINYDRNYLNIATNENTVDPLNVSDYIRQRYNFQNSAVATASGEIFAVYVSFTTRATYRGQGSGYNFQILNDPALLAPLYFDASQPININQDGGVWVSSTGGRLPVFASIEGGTQRYECFTKYTTIDNILDLKFLSFRTANAVAGNYDVDEIIVNITPLPYKQLEEFSFLAGFYTLNFNSFTAGREYKSIFHGGILSYDWYIFEGAIGYKEGMFNTLVTNQLWDRYQESHDEGSFGALTEITAKSILEFYGRTSRKITGNVWGEEISYPKYFEVQAAENKGFVTGIENSFFFRISADGGECETTYCGSNYVDEFATENSKFLMIEASFDYQQSTTAVNIHEDNSLVTGQNFEVFSGSGGWQSGNGMFPQSYGGTSNGIIGSEGE
jgi:hypothetical protein